MIAESGQLLLNKFPLLQQYAFEFFELSFSSFLSELRYIRQNEHSPGLPQFSKQSALPVVIV